MLKRSPRGESDTKEVFGLHPGDIGVVVIAAIFTLAFLLILFSRWQMPSISINATQAAQPRPKSDFPAGETEIMLFPSKKTQNQP